MTSFASEMSKTTQFILMFFGSGIVLFLIFYLYPAQIFDVKLVSMVGETHETVHLRAFLRLDNEFSNSLSESFIVMKRQLSGWMILFILVVGMPAMIAYRFAYSKKNLQPGTESTEEE